jgi:type IV secretory pathway protease TraF
VLREQHRNRAGRISIASRPIGAKPVALRGDIIVFESPRDGTLLVKRVIALPGDTVALDGERLSVNGVAARYAAGDSSELHSLLSAARARHPVAGGSAPAGAARSGERTRGDVLRARR